MLSIKSEKLLAVGMQFEPKYTFSCERVAVDMVLILYYFLNHYVAWSLGSRDRRYTQVLERRHSGRDAGIQRPGMANWRPRQMFLQPRT